MFISDIPTLLLGKQKIQTIKEEEEEEEKEMAQATIDFKEDKKFIPKKINFFRGISIDKSDLNIPDNINNISVNFNTNFNVISDQLLSKHTEIISMYLNKSRIARKEYNIMTENEVNSISNEIYLCFKENLCKLISIFNKLINKKMISLWIDCIYLRALSSLIVDPNEIDVREILYKNTFGKEKPVSISYEDYSEILRKYSIVITILEIHTCKLIGKAINELPTDFPTESLTSRSATDGAAILEKDLSSK
jgi:hypothetical protein